jgi:hypothetical protein
MTSISTDRLNAALEGRYRIEREVGSGGMATVFLAHDLRHDRKVALKVLRPELAAVMGAERFLTEIRTTANLQHPHILALFDSGEADGFLYFVMPFVEGETLRERVFDTARVPLVASTFDERAPAVSPDSRWIAYLSNQSGRADVYVRPFPDTDAGVWRISSEGASEPRWGRSSSELYYKNARRRMVRVSLDFSDGVRPVERQELFDVQGFPEDNAHWEYEVSSADGRILAVWDDEAGQARVVWIENFFTELDRRFSSAGGR